MLLAATFSHLLPPPQQQLLQQLLSLNIAELCGCQWSRQGANIELSPVARFALVT